MPIDVPQNESRNGYAKRVCFGCGKEGHYADSYPTKHKKTRSCNTRLYCLRFGEDGHPASWCEKKMIINDKSA